MGRTVYGYDGNVYETDIKTTFAHEGNSTGISYNRNFHIDGAAMVFKPPKNRSILYIGNMTIYNTKHFNWLNKIMFRIFFGIKIEDIKEEK